MRRLIIVSLITFCLLQNLVSADEPTKKPLPVETMHEIDTLEDLKENIEQMKLLIERMGRKKQSDCIKAFGNEKFCTCIREKSPVGIDFAGYVKVVTTTKEELGYSKADAETKGIIDNTLKAREICVSEK